MINPKCIEVFLAIVEHKSISAVAKRTHFSQPTVSEYLNQLEYALGVTLMLRGKGQRQITLTHAGEAFLPLAQKYMDQHQALELQIRQFTQTQTYNSLRLAASSGGHQLVVSNIVYNLVARCPDLHLQLCNVERREISSAIEASSFDIAITFGKVPDSELVTTVPLFDEQAFILCPADTLLPNRVITPADLDPHFEVLYSAHKSSQKFQQWHHASFPETDPSVGALGFEVSSLGSVQHYLTDPRSWTVVPASIAMSSIAQQAHQLTFRAMEPAPPSRICNALIHKAYKDSALINTFLQCCDAFIQERSYLRKL